MHRYVLWYGIAVIVLVMGWWLYTHKLKPYRLKQKLRAEFAGETKTLTLDALLEALYAETNAHNVSSRAREQMGIQSDEFTYGEIVFISFIAVLERLNIKAGEIFYDLGSGAGKAVFAAGLHYDFAKASGIELLPPLYELANQKMQQLAQLLKQHDKTAAQLYLKRLPHIQFINTNILAYDFSDANVIFINSTCFNSVSWDAITERFSHLAPGARIITITKSIKHEAFQLLFQEKIVMSWGTATVSAYEKIR